MGLREVLQQVWAVAIHVAVGVAAWRARDFDKELVFYGAFHQNPWNQLIHFVFVPTIWFSFILLHCYLPVFGFKGLFVPFTNHPVTWGTVQVLVYLSYYLPLDPNRGGRVYCLILIALYFLACRIVSSERDCNVDRAVKKGPAAKPVGDGKGRRSSMRVYHIAIILQVVSWYMQLHPGHKICEQVKPALLASLGQSFGVAPLFAFYEGVWFAGFEPELHDQVVAKVAAERRAMCTVRSHPSYNPDYAFCH